MKHTSNTELEKECNLKELHVVRVSNDFRYRPSNNDKQDTNLVVRLKPIESK